MVTTRSHFALSSLQSANEGRDERILMVEKAHTPPVSTSTDGWNDAAPSGSDAARPREPRSYVPTLALANFGVLIALLTPVLVSLALKVQALVGEGQANANLSLVLAVGALFALFANPLAGRLSDRTTSRFGMRRPWIVGGSILGFLSFVLIATATSIPMLTLGWCAAQIAFNAVLAAINASLPDQVAPERRGVPSGIVGIGAPMAILIGSILVNFFANDAGRFLAPAALGLILSLLFAFFLKDRTLAEKPARLSAKEFFGSFVFDPRKHPDFGWVWVTKFLFMFGYVGVNTFLTYYLIQEFDIPATEVSGTIVLINFAFIGATVLMSIVGGIVSDRIGKRRPLLMVSAIVMGIGLIVLATASTIPTVILAQTLVGLGAGTFFAVDLALATQVLPNPNDNAKDLGVLNMANALPQSIAPALAVPIMALGSALGIGEYQFWYIIGAVVTALGGVLVYRIKSVK
jgi:MFS family permease